MKLAWMLLEDNDSQLVLLDFQARLMPAIHHGGAVLEAARRLAAIAARLELPIWGTEHRPDALGPLDEEVRRHCRAVLPKMHFSAAAEGLSDRLRPAPPRAVGGNARSLPKHLQKAPSDPPPHRGQIVLAGCEAHVCLLQTALELIEDEFDVWVVTDASGSRHEKDRDAAFDRLAGAGCELVTVEMCAFEWLRTADHPDFRDVLALVK